MRACKPYWVQGNAESCRESLVASLSGLLAAGVHPLHYHCLEAYCLLTSTCRAAAGTGRGVGAVACAAAYALSSALAADHLLRAGRQAAMPSVQRLFMRMCVRRPYDQIQVSYRCKAAANEIF